MLLRQSEIVLFTWLNEENWPLEFVSENVTRYGYTLEDFPLGQTGGVRKFIHPEDREKTVLEVHEKSRASDVPFSLDCRVLTRWGESRWVQLNIVPEVDFSGEVRCYHGIAADFTRYRMLEQALRKKKHASLS